MKTKLKETQEAIDQTRDEIEEVTEHIAQCQDEIDDFDVSDYADENDYDAMLDETYGVVDVCGHEYTASYALKEVDPTAYRVGFSDYAASLDPTDFDEYQDLTEELEELEDKQSDLESDLETHENELEEPEED